MDSSDKMENSVLGYRLSEKVDHLPIKKRRFLFETPSSPPNTAPLEETVSVAACVDSSSQEVQPKPEASDPPAASPIVADLHQSGSIDREMDREKFLKDATKACKDEDICGTSLVDSTVCSNGLDGDADLGEVSGIILNNMKSLEATGNVELKEKSVKLETLSAMETDFDISAVPSKLDCSSADICDTSLVDQAACNNGLGGDADLGVSSGIVSNDTNSLEATWNVENKAKSVKLETLSAMETDFGISTLPSKLNCSSADKATVGESILDNSLAHVPIETECSKMNQVTIKTQNSADLDDRLNWDLNTVITAWEEPLECDKTIKTACGSVSENIGNGSLTVGLKSLTPKIEESELEACKPGSNGIYKLLSPVIFNAPRVNSLTSGIPVSDPSSLAAVTDFSLDYNKPKEHVGSSKVVDYGNSYNNGISTVQRTENEKLTLSLVTAGSIDHEVHQSGGTYDEDDKSKVKRVVTSNEVSIGDLIGKVTESSHNVVPITALQTTESEKLKLSLVTTTSLENVVHQSGSAFDEDDKSKVLRVMASNGITMDNLSGKGTEISKDGHEGKCKDVSQTNVGSLLVMQSSVSTESKDRLPAVSSKHEVVSSDAEVPIKSEKSPVTDTIYRRLSRESHAEYANDLVNNNMEVSDHEIFPSDIQGGSEVDNVEEEFSYGFTSQFEDGEFRESSIQTWDVYDEDDREIYHGTDLGAFDAHKNSSLCALESSQNGANEISNLLLPEKLNSSDRVSGSEPNETEKGITEVNMKDASHSDQWKMNISRSDILPENPTSSSSISKIRDLRNIKFLSRIGRYGPQDDLEMKAEGPRFYRREPLVTFPDKGRFRMQGCSSSNADDSFRSFRRAKYTSRIPTRGPFMGPSSLTNEPNVDPNIARQPFRTRLLANREEDEFRARLGLRPSNDKSQNRFVNVGRGRSLRYGSRHNGGGPWGRYYGPATNDEYDEPSMGYLHSIPVRRRCFSPTHHRSGSTSPPRSLNRSPINDSFRHRSRSPILQSDTRIRRINLEPRNNISPPTSKWVNYKQRPSLFGRRSSPPPPPSPINERVSFFDSSRKTKPSENYRPGPGRFSEVRGGGRGGPRFHDLPRRPREDRRWV